jgi:hypothetical protein
MTNPFKPHALNLFADRESVDKAMEYAHALLQTLDGPSATAATTALMVVVNTAAKLWPEAPAQADALAAAPALADALTWRLARLEERLTVLEVTPVTQEAMASAIESWADDNFNERADQWLNDEADLDDKIETWVENNLDIENEVADALRDKVYDTVRRVIRDEVSLSISI